ncbi:MAG: hypothetical protein L3J26_09935 [Candidatus Polarisedimenticolaceae bacterium]|nr:hypothetical protein [Candidatus Polarisedimenticolaceae bacterium]
MTSQDDKDWEEYQLGQQGTPTGSMHNQMGLNYRPKSAHVNQQSKKTKQQTKTKSPSSAGNEDFNVFFAVIAFIGTAIYLYNPPDENGVASLIGAGIVSLLAGKFYKFIIAIAIFIGFIFIFGAVNEGGSN